MDRLYFARQQLGRAFWVSILLGAITSAGSIIKRKIDIFSRSQFMDICDFACAKIPRPPPGVGDPNTIYFRQATYLSLLGIGALGAVLAAAVYWRSKANGLKRWLLSLYVIIFVTLSAILLLPNNPDAMTAPMSLVNNFRVLSVLGLLLFWLVFGVTHRFQLNRFIQ